MSALWAIGPVTVANHIRDDNMGAICPTLVLTGDQDLAIPNSLSKEMADGIAGAKLVILSQCGHLSQVEQPEATANALVEWLRL
jgi:pimeloyl-ACP methyl ester carboxylesterase